MVCKLHKAYSRPEFLVKVVAVKASLCCTALPCIPIYLLFFLNFTYLEVEKKQFFYDFGWVCSKLLSVDVHQAIIEETLGHAVHSTLSK